MKAGSAQVESGCVYVKPKKIMQQMHGLIPQLFDCWADPVAHLLLLKKAERSKQPRHGLLPGFEPQRQQPPPNIWPPLCTLFSSVQSDFF